MCRSIKSLFNYDPVATDEEIYNASLQFVRKVSGFQTPSKANKIQFDLAVQEIMHSTKVLLETLESNTPPKNRDIEAEKARQRSAKRFGAKLTT